MDTPEITKEIIIAMIEKGIIVSDSKDPSITYPEKQAKAVAAAYEIVYAGVHASSIQKR